MTTNEERIRGIETDHHRIGIYMIASDDVLKDFKEVQKEIDDLKIKLAFKNEKINSLDKEISDLKKDVRELISLQEIGYNHHDIDNLFHQLKQKQKRNKK